MVLVQDLQLYYKSIINNSFQSSRCAEIAPEVRFRFTSPHPKDFPESVTDAIKEYGNICKS